MQTQTLVLVKQRNHLETVLVNEPVVVNRGHQIVDVKPQVVSKGLVTGKVLSRMVQEGKAPDFVVCMGEDRSDEKMFESIATTLSAQSSSMFTQMFACQAQRQTLLMLSCLLNSSLLGKWQTIDFTLELAEVKLKPIDQTIRNRASSYRLRYLSLASELLHAWLPNTRSKAHLYPLLPKNSSYLLLAEISAEFLFVPF